MTSAPSLDQIKFPLSLLDRTVLAYHVTRGAQLVDEVGYEDIDIPLKELVKALSQKNIAKEVMESALWSCNMMAEAGKFWSPTGETWQQFISRVEFTYSVKFDYFYCFFTEGFRRSNG